MTTDENSGPLWAHPKMGRWIQNGGGGKKIPFSYEYFQVEGVLNKSVAHTVDTSL